MINYAHIKQSVTTRQAVESYGIHVNSHDMAVCPFHDDRRPSMKVDETFYCFGCGATGGRNHLHFPALLNLSRICRPKTGYGLRHLPQ